MAGIYAEMMDVAVERWRGLVGRRVRVRRDNGAVYEGRLGLVTGESLRLDESVRVRLRRGCDLGGGAVPGGDLEGAVRPGLRRWKLWEISDVQEVRDGLV